jgi:hypothetical protein
MKEKITLKEIADWQLNSEISKVELPSIQRGFVWKPKQVEDLWDSILREYPIGSFLFSECGEKFHLMDGQQRATSIFLGYLNPFELDASVAPWSIKGELPVVWIDIQPKTKPDTSKYLIRVTTHSHPWGYEAKNNGERLRLSDRRKALELFKKHPDNKGGYTSFKNITVFPFDACYPLPLSFFIESKSVEQVIEKAKNYLPDYISTKQGNFENKKDYLKLLNEELQNEMQAILGAVQKSIKKNINYDIVPDAVLREEEDVDDPTLFVRINSSGTTLSGDDLIYSIYKAIFPETKELVEKAGMSFIAPTQVISLASRFVLSELKDNQYAKKMNVREFQRRIKDDNFKNSLRELIGTDSESEIKNLFEKAIKLLKGNGLFESEIPPVIIKMFIKSTPDLFLFFVSWLRLHNTLIDEKCQLQMIAKLLSFSWFEFGEIWRLWVEIKDENFWSKPLNQYMWWEGKYGIHFLVPPILLRTYYQQTQIENRFLENHEHKWELNSIGNNIAEYYNKVKSENIDTETADIYFSEFINILRFCKQLILFAQRNYVNSQFIDYNQMEDLDDTNVPWDWDHIYPDSWVYNMKYCEPIIREWNNTTGNLRAMSLEQNRSQSNGLSPRERLLPKEQKGFFIQKNDWIHWQLIDGRIYDKEKVLNHFRAVTTRMINIYEKFWNDLKIEELIIF